jgi:hypothetical protein
LKLGQNVSAYIHQDASGSPLRAIHVSLKGFKALTEALGDPQRSETAIPEQLALMLRDGDARWVPGLRVGAKGGISRKEEVAHLENPRTVAVANGGVAQYEHEHKYKHEYEPIPPRFTYVELFAGIGGFRVGLDALGGRCVLTCEKDPENRRSYSANFYGKEGEKVRIVFRV